ncbi:hypothetical protein JZ751_008208, partial [Albula glossodonta]
MMSCALRFSPEYQMDFYKGLDLSGVALIRELIISITLESLADCMDHDQEFIVECIFTLAAERAMSRITTVTKNFFQHPDLTSTTPQVLPTNGEI